MTEFVRVLSGPSRGLGIGKIVAVGRGKVAVEFFDAPGDASQPQITVATENIKNVNLPEQTRVFKTTLGGQHWIVGRVLHCDGTGALVQFPNRDTQNVSKEELFVRWRRPIEDPSEFLARMITETPLFADARSIFYQSYVKQRAVSLGMGGLLSARIAIEPHQFEVVRRVLQDPIQRYLLADEVGLGKTIEAGALIRQYFLDHPEGARVLVVVPSPLKRQWKGELTVRFGLRGEFENDTLRVIAHNDLGAIAKELGQCPGMLVVDEAHHLSRVDAGKENGLFDLLTQFVGSIPRLLLLSATPAIADEAGFLRVLHLLDPLAFPLDRPEAFRRKIDARQVVAEATAALLPENALILESYLESLEDEFPSDNLLGDLIEHLREVLRGFPQEDEPRLLAALQQVKAHITETYRLHRRILRNRRKSVLNLTPERVGVAIREFSDGLALDYSNAFEAWRLSVDSAGGSIHDDLVRNSIRGFFEAPDQVLFSLAREERGNGASAAAEFIGSAHALQRSERRLVELRRCLTDYLVGGAKVIVFCSSKAIADFVFDDLRSMLNGAVVRHVVDNDDEDDEEDENVNATGWRQFLNVDSCQVLVCDSDAEEGLNLHGGNKILVHYDLPLSPNRIEQRLGRVDRYGSGDAVRSVALVCTDNRYEVAWAACLQKGFGVFQRSIASLQYLVDRTMEELLAEIVEIGVAAIDGLRSALAGSDGLIERELRRIDQQDILDSLAIENNTALDELYDVDDAWKDISEAVRTFAVNILQFGEFDERLNTRLPPGDRVVRFLFARGGQRETLFPVQDLIDYFIGAIDFESPRSTYRTPLTFPYTARRNSAITREALQKDVHLLRYGDPFVDALGNFAATDDRGRVFGLWRFDSDYQSAGGAGHDLYFRLEFLIEADTRDAERVLRGTEEAVDRGISVEAPRRQADGILQPIFVRIWVNEHLEIVESVPEIVARPYRSKEVIGSSRDYNLNAMRWQVLREQDFYALEIWPNLCLQVRRCGEHHALQSGVVTTRLREAHEKASALRDQRIAQLQLRIGRMDDASVGPERENLENERHLYEALIAGMVTPSVTLDSIGAVFVSSRSPFQS